MKGVFGVEIGLLPCRRCGRIDDDCDCDCVEVAFGIPSDPSEPAVVADDDLAEVIA